MPPIFTNLMGDDNDKEFITSLYLQYYPLLKSKAYHITKDYGVIDDLIQDTFLKLIPKIPLLRSLNSYKVASYLVTTMRHVAIDYIRKETRRSKRSFSGSDDDLADLIPDSQAATEENYILDEEAESLETALFQLSERDRTLLYSKYNMGMSDKEIAKLLDIPANHVRQYTARARRRALRILSERGEFHEKDE